jgi:uncharacterized surface protein with fasciclin (FAS1) repeats
VPVAGPFTFFAPSDQAFAESGLTTDDADNLVDLLSYHLVSVPVRDWLRLAE